MAKSLNVIIITTLTKPDNYITIGGVVIELPNTIHDCKCRNIRQRNAAIRQAHLISSGLTTRKSQNSGYHQISNQSRGNRVILDKYLGKSRLCRECVRNALLLEGVAHDGSFVKYALEALNPLPVSPYR